MEVVLDANVLFRILISQGDILEVVFSPSLKILAPEQLKEEFLRNKPELVNKSRFSISEFESLSIILLERIEFISVQDYKNRLKQANDILRGHSKDEDFLALCLARGCKFWTYETRFFKLGYAISTKQLSKALQE